MGLLLILPVKAAGNISVTARMDSVNLLMGNVTTLYLQVVKDEGRPGGFPLLEASKGEKEYVGVCGDSVELRSDFQVDTTRIGGDRIQLNYKVTLQAFDSGTYRLPEFVYVSGNDSSYSNNLTFNVIPVNVTADDPIAGFAGPSDPEGARFYDFVPNWLLDYLWIFFVIALAVILFLYAMRRRKTGAPLLKPVKVYTPDEIAIRDLLELKDRKLWEQGMEKEYFTRLTEILRTYLMQRFGINALEMTTRQIIEKVNESEFKDKRDYVKQILNVADFVKFAKVRPLPADNIAAFDNALRFVEETRKLSPEEENKEKQDKPDIGKAGKGEKGGENK